MVEPFGGEQSYRVMTRRIAVLGIVLLAACEPAAEEPPSAEPVTEVDRESLCAEVHNVYECSRVVETHLLGRGAPGVTRSGDTLTIALEDGSAKTLVDHGQRADVVYYTYDGRLDAAGYHVVQVHYYEGGAHLLVDASTGEETRIAGPPVASPDGTRLAIASYGGVAGYAPNLLRIRRVEPDALPVEWEHEGDWGADSPRWLDPATLRFTRLRVCDGGTCESPAELRYREGEWTVREVQ